MIPPGTKVSQRGNKLTVRSNEECHWLYLILQAIETQTGTLSLGTITQNYTLGSSSVTTLAAYTYKQISFQVISGTLTVSMDGGTTSTVYPAGSNINVSAGIIGTEWILTVSSGGSSLLQTIAP